MWSKRQHFQFSVMLGLRKGLRLIRAAKRTFTEDEQEKIAGAIVEHLEHSNWKVEQGPEPQGHSAIMGATNEAK
jgi:hypothetical protein